MHGMEGQGKKSTLPVESTANKKKTKRVVEVEEETGSGGGSAYERLKRLRADAGSRLACIPETWGAAGSLFECSAGRVTFERPMPEGLLESARESMVDDCRSIE